MLNLLIVFRFFDCLFLRMIDIALSSLGALMILYTLISVILTLCNKYLNASIWLTVNFMDSRFSEISYIFIFYVYTVSLSQQFPKRNIEFLCLILHYILRSRFLSTLSTIYIKARVYGLSTIIIITKLTDNAPQ